MHKGSIGVSVAAFLGLALSAGLAVAGITLLEPEVTVREGDRVVDLSWKDPHPEVLVSLDQPRLGSAQFPWRGKATVEAAGLYVGACDWTYDVSMYVTPDSIDMSWSKVTDWRTRTTQTRRVRLEETDLYYDFCDGIKVRIPSAGLFRVGAAGWSGPQPAFAGIYYGGQPADTVVSYSFTCTSGGNLSSGGGTEIDFGWTNSLGESGSLVLSRAGENTLVHKGLKVAFPEGAFAAGQGFSLDVRIPFGKPDPSAGLPADGFKIKCYTFEGYLVLRRSVEDRPATAGDTLYKVIADMSRCGNPEFFADATGQQAPDSTRYFTDRGIRGGTVGVTPDSTALVVLNGFPYKYAVLTYDWSDDYRLITCDTTWTRVYPSVSPTGKTAEEVYVVPNPYRFNAGWEEAEAKMQFVNVPAGAVIRIYDAAGGLIRTVVPAHKIDGTQGGTADWNLRDNDGEQVVSGIYMYRVEAGGASKMGRFIVVR
jgi:hypothetical protein